LNKHFAKLIFIRNLFNVIIFLGVEMNFTAVLAFAVLLLFGFVACYTQEEGIQYVKAYCHTMSRQNPTLYAKYKLDQKCYLVVEIFKTKVILL